MRFLGQIAGKQLQLSSQCIGICFHSAAAVVEVFNYLYLV